jgi:hypothetical protein
MPVSGQQAPPVFIALIGIDYLKRHIETTGTSPCRPEPALESDATH